MRNTAKSAQQLSSMRHFSTLLRRLNTPHLDQHNLTRIDPVEAPTRAYKGNMTGD